MEIIYPPLIGQGVAFFHPKSSKTMSMKAKSIKDGSSIFMKQST
ncbi:hypothetical protein HMPREF9088_0946 [Enterococcus italicus DSM 15952]|uniref:Uncharacterized protein n=1 Tax=Enterococcus italicus (strain DSM 15952 / CCUG 50447 / LMG 22039 / TP 1.5) TaxID=888064 RepID=E6LF32_ENTI1|nr:hypothetical protein HMPREF9088_0946 [Enterococcus italicus DSM 15952]OJG59921.1 hypothetical protein RT43_GL002133 [Enterococcus italicus DSM 15952]